MRTQNTISIIFFIFIATGFLPVNSKAQITGRDSVDFQHLVHKVMELNQSIDSLNKRIVEEPSNQELKIDYNKFLQECFQIPKDFIKRHPSSILTIQALRMLGSGSLNTPAPIDTLNELFSSLSQDLKESEEGRAYKISLRSWNKTVLRDEALIKSSIDKYSKWGYLDHVGYNQSLKKITSQQDPSVISNTRMIIALDSLAKQSVSVTGKFQKPGKKKLSGTKIYERLKSATMILALSKPSLSPEFLKATGYVIEESGIVVTNYHVVKTFADRLLSNFQMINSDGDYFPVIKVLAVSPVNDLAVLQIDTKGKNLPALPLGGYSPEGTKIFAMGHSKEMFYYFSNGMVAGNYIYVDNGYDGERVLGHPIMSITADYSVGASGGPVVNEYGNVVGTISQTKAVSSDDINKAEFQMVIRKTIPVGVLKEMIKIN